MVEQTPRLRDKMTEEYLRRIVYSIRLSRGRVERRLYKIKNTRKYSQEDFLGWVSLHKAGECPWTEKSEAELAREVDERFLGDGEIIGVDLCEPRHKEGLDFLAMAVRT